MKKIIAILILIYCLLGVSSAYAVSPTPQDPTPTSTSLINNLKDRIASRVAELKLVERRGVIGTVTEVSQTQLTLTDLKGNTRFIDVDELTKFASPSAKESFGISDISKGSRLGVLGLYNKQSRRILSRFVDVIVLPKTVRGAVASIDSENYVVNVIKEDGTIVGVDIEDITKTISFDQTGTATKSGFSKIKEGERIVVVGFPNKTNPSNIIGSRIMIFPNLPKNPKIPATKNNTPSDTPVSTGSGKKLTPLTR